MISALQRVRLKRAGFAVRRVSLRGGELAAMVATGGGSGPPLVMLHGLGVQGGAYAGLVADLLPRVRSVVLPDLPGHGLSVDWQEELNSATMVRAMKAALPQLVEEPAVLFGNSLGGYGALRLACEDPEMVRGVVVTSPGGGAVPEERRRELLERYQPTTHAEALDLVERSLTELRGPARHVLAIGVRRMLARPSIVRLVRSVTPDDDLDPTALGQLSVPIRLLWGTEERALVPEQLEWFRRHLPEHAELREPEGWGHAAFRERPAEVLDELHDFLDRLG